VAVAREAGRRTHAIAMLGSAALRIVVIQS
jgi:uncharacterized membrane protein YhiD involved in acid resistance